MSDTNYLLREKRKRYTVEFKDHVLDRASREGVAQVARELDIRPSLIYEWRKKLNEGGSITLSAQKAEETELMRLQRENRRLSMEVDFLKKAAAYFAKERK